MTSPLQWTILTGSIRREGAFAFEANAVELDALKRFAEVDDLTSFSAHVKVLHLAGEKFRVTGTFAADLVQSSVVDLQAVPARIEESFSLEYWPSDLIAEAGEPPFDEDPPEPLSDGRIAIGELLCELLLVSIDPYPRNESGSFQWTDAESGLYPGPFASLARLKHRDKADEG
jgi:hypothetical protein